MTQRETFAEFVERVKPKESEVFTDGRGVKWVYYQGEFISPNVTISLGLGKDLTHNFLEPKRPKLLAPGRIKDQDGFWYLTGVLYSSLEQFQEHHSNYSDSGMEHEWPALPNAQGFYEVEDNK